MSKIKKLEEKIENLRSQLAELKKISNRRFRFNCVYINKSNNNLYILLKLTRAVKIYNITHQSTWKENICKSNIQDDYLGIYISGSCFSNLDFLKFDIVQQ